MPTIYKARVFLTRTIEQSGRQVIITLDTQPSPDAAAVSELARGMIAAGIAQAYRIIECFDRNDARWYNTSEVVFLPDHHGEIYELPPVPPV